MTEQLIQLGIGGVSIGAIVIITKCFIGFITVQEKNFTKLLGNHIQHNSQAFNDLKESNYKLSIAIDKLLERLK